MTETAPGTCPFPGSKPPEQKATDQFNSKRAICSRTGNLALRNGWRNIDVKLPAYGKSKYQQLAAAYGEVFYDQLESLYLSETEGPLFSTTQERDWARTLAKGGAIRVGFGVLGNIMECLADSYRIFCAENSKDLELQELATALLDPNNKKTVMDYFANTSSDIASHREDYFGITNSSFKRYEAPKPNGFRFSNQPDSSGLIVTLDEQLMDIAAKKVNDWVVEEGKDKSCVALKVLLPRLWDTMAQYCAEDPRFFAADLGLVPEAIDT